jgi:hypothetical protein
MACGKAIFPKMKSRPKNRFLRTAVSINDDA